MKEIFYSKIDPDTGLTTRGVYAMSTKTGFILQNEMAAKISDLPKAQMRMLSYLLINQDVINTREVHVTKSFHDKYRKHMHQIGLNGNYHNKNITRDVLGLLDNEIIYRVSKGIYKFSKKYVVPANIYERAEDVKFELELPYVEHLKNKRLTKDEVIINSN